MVVLFSVLIGSMLAYVLNRFAFPSNKLIRNLFLFATLFPLLRPAMVTVMILKGIVVYNEYYTANLYLQDKTKFVTISTALYSFTGPFGNRYNVICAGVILTMIPILLIFIFCQRAIYSGLAAGAVKG